MINDSGTYVCIGLEYCTKCEKIFRRSLTEVKCDGKD